MKKILSCLLSFAFVASVYSSSYTFSLPVTGRTNVPPPTGGALLLTQVVLSATATNNAYVSLVDSPTNQVTYVTSAYTNTTSYVTNCVTSWTNYYNVVNTVTNVCLVDIANVVGQATNSYPVRLALNATTNATTFNGTWYFSSGLMVTNTGANAATITITYYQ